jgi:broad specificity phosphatase PhoE
VRFMPEGKLDIIKLARYSGLGFKKTLMLFGIKPHRVWQWIRNIEDKGFAGLIDKPPIPKSSPGKHLVEEENLIIVGHGGTNSVILTELIDIPFKPWSVLSFGIDHASIATIVSVPVDKHQLFRLHKLNDTHLLTPDKITR